MFILRGLLILILLAMALASVAPAIVGTIEHYNLPVDLGPIEGPSGTLEALAASTDMIERVLWYAAAVFFFIAAIRLIRRTQGFWMWLFGFACYGGRWAWSQHKQGGLTATIESVEVQSFTSTTTLAEGGTPTQLIVLIVMLVVGVLVFIVDSADRAYWDQHGG